MLFSRVILPHELPILSISSCFNCFSCTQPAVANPYAAKKPAVVNPYGSFASKKPAGEKAGGAAVVNPYGAAAASKATSGGKPQAKVRDGFKEGRRLRGAGFFMTTL